MITALTKRTLFFFCLAAFALAGLVAASVVDPASADHGSGLPHQSGPRISQPPASGALAHSGRAVMPQQGTPTPTPGQCVDGYTCVLTPSATIVPGTTDTGNHCDDCTTKLTLPFPVSLYAVSYTGVNVSSNGNAQFVSSNSEFNNTCLPVTSMGPTIFAYWDDLDTDGTQCTGGCGIYTSVSGSAPNRIFNIEWRTFYFSEPGNAYFEIRLYEATSTFEIILGQVNIEATATIGVQDGAGRYTQCECNTQPPANSRLVFTFSTCGTPLPTQTVVGTTPTPTRTATLTSTSTPTSTPTPTGTIVPPTPSVTNTPTTGAVTGTPTATPTLCPLNFSDVHPDDYFYTPVQYLYCRGVISGYDDGTFRPYNLTTRGQLTKIVALAEGWTTYSPPTPTFQDVSTTHTFYQYIETAYHHGIISGYSCGPDCLEFRPGNNVTRAQLCKIVTLAEQWPPYSPPTPTFQDVPPTDPFYVYVETAYSHGIISGYNCGPDCLEFRPSNNATRGQICVIVYRAVTNP